MLSFVMGDNPQETPEKSISERLQIVLAQLTPNQLRYITARQEYPTKKEAAESVKLTADTVYRWPSIVEEAVELTGLYLRESALAILERKLLLAVMVKAGGLESDDEDVKQRAATEIIDRVLGKATQAIDNRHSGDLTVHWVDALSDDDDIGIEGNELPDPDETS